jgi:Uma2 family endonuclease
MATVTDLEIDDLESEEREARIVEPRKHFEVVDGQIVEEPPLGAYEGRIAARIVRSIVLFDPMEDWGEVVEEILFIFKQKPRLRRRPDVAFVSRERWSVDRPMDRDAAWDVIPDIAVEITSPTDFIDDLMDKIDEYFAAGVRLVWVIYSKQNKLYAYDSPTSVRVFQVGDDLEGGLVLPGFRLPLSKIFKTTKDEPSPEA